MNRREVIAAAVAAGVSGIGARRLGGDAGPLDALHRGDLAAGGRETPAGGPASAFISPVGVQLYTVRGEMQRDFEATLTRVAAIGYREVEFAGYFGRTPQRVGDALRANRLSAPSAHVDVRTLQDPAAWDRMLDDARIIGHRYLVVAWMPAEMRRTLDDWRRIGALFTAAGETARRRGITFAYHNHDFEFAPLEGQLPFDVLLQASDPRMVRIELDLFWIRKGGQDALDYFARWPGRFPMVHVKDMDAEGRMTDVGAGVIDWCTILGRSRQAGIRHYFVEHDQPADAFASIEAGFNALRPLDTSGRRCRPPL